jgi:Flp pilus assembly protein TadG
MLHKPLNDDSGASVLETALLLPLLLLLFLGAIDFGRAYYAALEVSSAAQAGALYGSQNATDTSGMVAAAKLEVPDMTGINPTATYGCECSDGSSSTASCSPVPTCAYNVVNYVSVATTVNYNMMFKFPGLPSSVKLTGLARMRAAH